MKWVVVSFIYQILFIDSPMEDKNIAEEKLYLFNIEDEQHLKIKINDKIEETQQPFVYNSSIAKRKFLGVRKIYSINNDNVDMSSNELLNGSRLIYSLYFVESEYDAKKIVNQEEVFIEYCDYENLGSDIDL